MPPGHVEVGKGETLGQLPHTGWPQEPQRGQLVPESTTERSNNAATLYLQRRQLKKIPNTRSVPPGICYIPASFVPSVCGFGHGTGSRKKRWAGNVLGFLSWLTQMFKGRFDISYCSAIKHQQTVGTEWWTQPKFMETGRPHTGNIFTIDSYHKINVCTFCVVTEQFLFSFVPL